MVTQWQSHLLLRVSWSGASALCREVLQCVLRIRADSPARTMKATHSALCLQCLLLQWGCAHILGSKVLACRASAQAAPWDATKEVLRQRYMMILQWTFCPGPGHLGFRGQGFRGLSPYLPTLTHLPAGHRMAFAGGPDYWESMLLSVKDTYRSGPAQATKLQSGAHEPWTWPASAKGSRVRKQEPGEGGGLWLDRSLLPSSVTSPWDSLAQAAASHCHWATQKFSADESQAWQSPSGWPLT